MSPIPSPQGPGHEMTLIDHLEELRARLIRCIIAAVVGFLVCFAFAKEILEILLHPLNMVLPAKSQVIGTGLTEPLFVSMKASFVAGIFLTSPYIFVQIWRFISPGLYEEERRLLIPVGFFTALCFVSGACFGYFIVFPFGFKFLANYASEVVTLMPNLKDYYSFALSLLLAFGVIFEMPVFIFFLARLGIVDSRGLRKMRRWAIVIIFIVAAVLTPTPDVVNQLLMACPMVILYEISIWVAHFFGKRKRRPTDETLPVPTDTPPAGGEGGASGEADEASVSERALPAGSEGETPSSEPSPAPLPEGEGAGEEASSAESPPDQGDPSAQARTSGQAQSQDQDQSPSAAQPDQAAPASGDAVGAEQAASRESSADQGAAETPGAPEGPEPAEAPASAHTAAPEAGSESTSVEGATPGSESASGPEPDAPGRKIAGERTAKPASPKPEPPASGSKPGD